MPSIAARANVYPGQLQAELPSAPESSPTAHHEAVRHHAAYLDKLNKRPPSPPTNVRYSQTYLPSFRGRVFTVCVWVKHLDGSKGPREAAEIFTRSLVPTRVSIRAPGRWRFALRGQ